MAPDPGRKEGVYQGDLTKNEWRGPQSLGYLRKGISAPQVDEFFGGSFGPGTIPLTKKRQPLIFFSFQPTKEERADG